MPTRNVFLKRVSPVRIDPGASGTDGGQGDDAVVPSSLASSRACRHRQRHRTRDATVMQKVTVPPRVGLSRARAAAHTRVEHSVPKYPGHATGATRPGVREGEEIRDTSGTRGNCRCQRGSPAPGDGRRPRGRRPPTPTAPRPRPRHPPRPSGHADERTARCGCSAGSSHGPTQCRTTPPPSGTSPEHRLGGAKRCLGTRRPDPHPRSHLGIMPRPRALGRIQDARDVDHQRQARIVKWIVSHLGVDALAG